MSELMFLARHGSAGSDKSTFAPAGTDGRTDFTAKDDECCQIVEATKAASANATQQVQADQNASPGIQQDGPDMTQPGDRRDEDVYDRERHEQMIQAAMVQFEEDHRFEVSSTILRRMCRRDPSGRSHLWWSSDSADTNLSTGPHLPPFPHKVTTVVVVNADLSCIAKLCHFGRIPAEKLLVHAEVHSRDYRRPWAASQSLHHSSCSISGLLSSRGGRLTREEVQISCVHIATNLDVIMISDLSLLLGTPDITTRFEPKYIKPLHSDLSIEEAYWSEVWATESITEGTRYDKALSFARVVGELIKSLLDNEPALQRGFREAFDLRQDHDHEKFAAVLFYSLASRHFNSTLESVELELQELAYRAVESPGTETLGQLASVRRQVAKVQLWLEHVSSPSSNYAHVLRVLQDYDDAMLRRRNNTTSTQTTQFRTIFERWDEVRTKIANIKSSLNESTTLLIGAITVQDSAIMKAQAERTTLLTILAIIYLPLTLVTGIFGMNIKEFEVPPRWWYVIIGVLITAVSSLILFGVLYGLMRKRRQRKQRAEKPIGQKLKDKWEKIVFWTSDLRYRYRYR